MIEITCLLNNAIVQLDFNDKNGKMIENFGYGKVINEDNCNVEDIRKSMEGGVLKVYLDKRWAYARNINVKGAIIGAPVPFKGVSDTEVETIMAKKQEIDIKIEDKAEKLEAKI